LFFICNRYIQYVVGIIKASSQESKSGRNFKMAQNIVVLEA